MIEQVKTGDKLTLIKVNSLAATSISEITIESIQNERIVFTQKRKKYYLNETSDMLVLKGHNLGITQGSWNNGGSCFIMSGNCNLGGLDRESMIALLNTNINPQFDQWQNIYWFDGTSDKGDPIFVPRPVSDNYLRYAEEAEQNKHKTADQINVGDFMYSYQKSSKYNGLMDMLKEHLTVYEDFSEYLSLGKIVAIMEMNELEFDALEYMGSEVELPDKGGSYSEDIAQEHHGRHNYSKFERETFYSHFTLIRTPSGRAITVDAQGYDYMRYTGLLPHYKTSMAIDCAKAQESLRLEREEVQREEDAKKREAERAEQAEIVRVEKEYSFLTVITDYQDHNTIAKNLRTLLKKEFPTTKFSVRKYYYDSYTVSWDDGSSEKQVREITRLFVDQGFDGMTDSSFSITSPFIQRYGGIGSISTDRNISKEVYAQELELMNKELEKEYKMEDYVTERCERASTLIYQRVYKKDYSPAVEHKTTPQPAVENISAQGIEIIDYSERAFAIIGDTKPIKETMKQLGGSFNSRLSCGAGWIFPKAKMETVKQTLSII